MTPETLDFGIARAGEEPEREIRLLVSEDWAESLGELVSPEGTVRIAASRTRREGRWLCVRLKAKFEDGLQGFWQADVRGVVLGEGYRQPVSVRCSGYVSEENGGL